VLLFARYAELMGAGAVEVILPDHADIAQLVSALRNLPGGALLPPELFVAVNLRRAHLATVLGPGDEIAVLPPLAGG
jgi:molybdopterin converting factor small subunit